MALCRAWSNPSGGWRSRGRFTHPWVGQAEHLACRKRQPAHLRAWPAPTLRRERPAYSSTKPAGRREPLPRPCGPCVPVSGRRWGQRPCRGYLDSVGPHVGRRLSGPSESRERTPPGSPVSGLLGAFDFSTRIKGGGRKRPSPGHKAPRCGAFPAFAEGAPFRHSRWF